MLQDFDFDTRPGLQSPPPIPRGKCPPLHPLVMVCCIVYLVVTALGLIASIASAFQMHHALGGF